MHRTLRFMQRTGTAAFLDFREFGIDGATALREAASGLDIEDFIFGSDDSAVLDVADGFGASGANDDDVTTERAAAEERAVRRIHAGEPDATASTRRWWTRTCWTTWSMPRRSTSNGSPTRTSPSRSVPVQTASSRSGGHRLRHCLSTQP